jgi:hypothetical protein
MSRSICSRAEESISPLLIAAEMSNASSGAFSLLCLATEQG